MSVVYVVFSLWFISSCNCESYLLGFVKTDETPVIEALSWHSLQTFHRLNTREPMLSTIPYPQDYLTEVGLENKSVLVNATSVKVRYPKSQVIVNPLPLASLGTEYIVYYNPPFENYTPVVVLASDDRTQVNVTVINDTTSNDNISKTLEPFQTWTLNRTGIFPGVFIRSSRRVAVFCGARSPDGTILSYEQLPAVDSYGKQYAVSVDSQNYQLQVISNSNGTSIRCNNGSEIQMNETRSIPGENSIYIFNANLSKSESFAFNTTDNVMVILSKINGDFAVVTPASAYKQIPVYSHFKDTVVKVMSYMGSNITGKCGNQSIAKDKHEDITGTNFSVFTYNLEESAICYIYSDKPFSILEFNPTTGSPEDSGVTDVKACGTETGIDQPREMIGFPVDSNGKGTLCLFYNRNMSDVQCYDLYLPTIAILLYGAVNIFLILLLTIAVLCLCCRLSGSHYKRNIRQDDVQTVEDPSSQKESKPIYAKVNKRKTYPNTKNANGGPVISGSDYASRRHTTEYEDIDQICHMRENADGAYSNNFELRLPALKTSSSFSKGDYAKINDRTSNVSKTSANAPAVPPYVPDPLYTDVTPRRSLVKRKISDSILLDKPKPTFSLTDDFKYEMVEGKRASLGNLSRRNERALSDGAAPSGFKPRFEGDGPPVYTVPDVEGRTQSMMVTQRKVERVYSDGGTASEFVTRGPIYSVVEKRKRKSNLPISGGAKGEKGVTVVHILDSKENIYSLAKM